MTEKQPSNRHPTRRQVGQGSLRPPTGRPTNHPIGDYCTLVLGLAQASCLHRNRGFGRLEACDTSHFVL